MKTKLSPKQIEVITRMRHGENLEVQVMEGNRVNKYFLGKDRRPLKRRNIVDLYDMGLINNFPHSYCKSIFKLTELGKTIEL